MMNVLDAVYSLASQIERNLLWSEGMGFQSATQVSSTIEKRPAEYGFFHAGAGAVSLWLLAAYLTC